MNVTPALAIIVKNSFLQDLVEYLKTKDSTGNLADDYPSMLARAESIPLDGPLGYDFLDEHIGDFIRSSKWTEVFVDCDLNRGRDKGTWKANMFLCKLYNIRF